jgi:hypothetical protein
MGNSQIKFDKLLVAKQGHLSLGGSKIQKIWNALEKPKNDRLWENRNHKKYVHLSFWAFSKKEFKKARNPTRAPKMADDGEGGTRVKRRKCKVPNSL